MHRPTRDVTHSPPSPSDAPVNVDTRVVKNGRSTPKLARPEPTPGLPGEPDWDSVAERATD